MGYELSSMDFQSVTTVGSHVASFKKERESEGEHVIGIISSTGNHVTGFKRGKSCNRRQI